MIRLLAALLLATAACPGGVCGQVAGGLSSPFVPDTVLQPSGGPRIVILGTPGEGVAALRLAVPLREGYADAGAGVLLRELALHRMETLARPVGVRVNVSRTPWGLAYSVEGAAVDFEYLAYLLRQAVAEPDDRGPALAEARLRLVDAVAGTHETPGGLLLSRLRSAVAPGLPPLEGTAASVNALDAERVRSVWRRSHQASTMTLVVSAPVVPEVILAATRGLGAPEEYAAGPQDTPAPRAGDADAETLRTYYGEAFHGGPAEGPQARVAALLVARQLQGSAQGFELGLEVWELPGQWVMAVTGAAYPGQATAMRRAVSSALVATRDAMAPASVVQAVADLRRDHMLRARTPGGLVAVVGRAMEANGDDLAAARGVDALAEVDLTTTRGFLDRLTRSAPVRAEVRR